MRTFGIAELAAHTGLTPGVLRTWEHRFGFPSGTRNPAGHRRFTDSDISLVQQVTIARSQGLPLAVAIESVLQQQAQAEVSSVFGAITEQFPQLRPTRVHRSTLLQVSRAIEDECLSQGDRPLVLGAFQSADRFAQSAARWSELSRSAGWAAIVADLSGIDGSPALPQHLPVLCDLSPDSPMRREWSVVCVGPRFAATLAAWQIPDGSGRYEAVVSSQPVVALAAARALVAVMEVNGAPVPARVHDHLATRSGIATPPPGTAEHSADTLLARVLTNLDHERALP